LGPNLVRKRLHYTSFMGTWHRDKGDSRVNEEYFIKNQNLGGGKYSISGGSNCKHEKQPELKFG
jgi:hypothetical protein